jgi:hypothetical protein
MKKVVGLILLMVFFLNITTCNLIDENQKDNIQTQLTENNDPPVINNIVINGVLAVDVTLSVNYDYNDLNGDPEGTPIYKWYFYEDAAGTIGESLKSTQATYTITNSDKNLYFKVELTPIAQSGTIQGDPVVSSIYGPIIIENAPLAQNVTINGPIINTGKTLTGSYDYFDEEGDLEGSTITRWISFTDAACTLNKTVLSTNPSLPLTAFMEGLYLKYEVTPIALTGLTDGLPTYSTAVGPVTNYQPTTLFTFELANNLNPGINNSSAEFITSESIKYWGGHLYCSDFNSLSPGKYWGVKFSAVDAIVETVKFRVRSMANNGPEYIQIKVYDNSQWYTVTTVTLSSSWKVYTIDIGSFNTLNGNNDVQIRLCPYQKMNTNIGGWLDIDYLYLDGYQ